MNARQRLLASLRRRSGRRDEAGYVTVVISIMIPALFIGLAATAVDTSRWYLEGERIQKAADAAAMAGVPFLPQDLASARTRALEVAARNGFDDADPGVVVTVVQAAKSTQLRVTIRSTISNQFGQIIGVGSTSLTRTSVADFTGPAPMGSPCNTFGTEPNVGTGSFPTPTGSAIGAPTPSCPRNPMMWASVAGPEVGKVHGDRYGTVNCLDSAVDFCDGGPKNLEYPEGSDRKGERGYFWVIKVQPEMVNRPIKLQLFDPAFVLTGQTCGENNPFVSTDQLPSFSGMDDNMNPFVTTDGRVRYSNWETVPNGHKATVAAPFCTGDHYPGVAAPTTPLTTTFMVREQTDSMDPLQGAVITDCAKQYGALTTYPTYDNLKLGRPTYNAQLAELFHNWTQLCQFTPTRAGDYYLHVRTNKSHTFGSNELMRSVPTGSVSSISGASGDSSPSGGGVNSFAIRAVTPAGLERGVAVSGWERMPIYANSDSATTVFPLVRALPGAAGQYIEFSFFDAGDAAGTATVKVLLPNDATSTSGGAIATPFPGSCTTHGGTAGSGQTLTNCQATLTQSSSGVSLNNGKVQTMIIPIPPDYTCDATVFTGCWYRVQISFASGSVHDVTTWDAEIAGDPVRLVE